MARFSCAASWIRIDRWSRTSQQWLMKRARLPFLVASITWSLSTRKRYEEPMPETTKHTSSRKSQHNHQYYMRGSMPAFTRGAFKHTVKSCEESISFVRKKQSTQDRGRENRNGGSGDGGIIVGSRTSLFVGLFAHVSALGTDHLADVLDHLYAANIGHRADRERTFNHKTKGGNMVKTTKTRNEPRRKTSTNERQSARKHAAG